LTVNNSSARVRPYAGRDEDFALAMRRAEERAEGSASGKPLKVQRPGDAVGRTRDGFIVLKNGRTFYPEYASPEKFAYLPILD
jgi:hypothetical protein